MEADQQTNHERVRRELWAAIYRQAHAANVSAPAQRVEPEFRWAEAADRAVEQFDRRFQSGQLAMLPRGTPVTVGGGLESRLPHDTVFKLSDARGVRVPGEAQQPEGPRE